MCYLTFHVISHFMLSRSSCYLTLHVISLFMLSHSSCYLKLHVISNFTLPRSSSYLTLHVSTPLRCHHQGAHLCKTAGRYWLELYIVQDFKIICLITNAFSGSVFIISVNKIMSENVVLVGKREGKRRVWRPSSGWKYNIKMNFKHIEWEVLECI
jgi:hypothetical protein